MNPNTYIQRSDVAFPTPPSSPQQQAALALCFLGLETSHAAKQVSAKVTALLVALIFCCLGNLASGQTSLTNGLVAYYSFDDGTATNHAGTGLNGTLSGGVMVVDGWLDKALRFDGIDDAVNLGSIQTLTNLTVSAFFRVESYPTPHNGGSWTAIVDAGPSPDIFGVRADYRSGILKIFAYYQYNPGGVTLISTSVVELNRFYHVAFTVGADKAQLYLNGRCEVEASTLGAQVGSVGQSPLVIGNRMLNEIPFAGTIDEVWIYDRALSSNEVQFLNGYSVFITQPKSMASLPGGVVTFSALARGLPPLAYQWRFNGTNLLAGQTNTTLLLSNVQPAQAGSYSVTVSNGTRVIISTNALLTLLAAEADDDGDGVLNALELSLGTNPLSPDSDGDGLTDYQELFVHGTNPLKADTDDDGLPDKWEIDHGLNPLVNDTALDLDLDGLTNLEEYTYNLTHTNQLNPRSAYSGGSSLSDYEVVKGTFRGTRYYYDRDDRLVGAEYSKGVSIAYQYDGNGNLVRQATFSRVAETNGLPVLWRFLNGFTNNTPTQSNYGDADNDGWSNYQEWLAGSNPRSAQSTPSQISNPGDNIASLTLPFTPSNFVVGVGQLDGTGAEEIVLGADGNPGGATNFLIVLTQGPTSWSTQRVHVGPFGITSVAVGQVTNRPGAGIYVGLRGTNNGSGRVMEFTGSGGIWQSNLVASSTNKEAFVLGVRKHDLLANYAPSNGVDGGLYSLAFLTNSWSPQPIGTNTAHRGLGTVAKLGTNQSGLRLLDSAGIEIEFRPALPTNAVFWPTTSKYYLPTMSKMTWSNAQAYAQQFGGNLVTIEGSSENAFVRSLFPIEQGIWIGLYRNPGSNKNDPNSWKWLSGSTSLYRNWHGGEPSDGGGTDLELWVHVFPNLNTWNDGLYTTTYFAVGERLRLVNALAEPTATRTNNWRGNSLASGLLRGTNGNSIFYTFVDDKNANGLIDLGDGFVTAEYLVNGTNASLLTLSRQPISAATPAQSYGLASVNFLNSSNEVFFTGEPDGQVFSWTATGSTNPLQRQLFSAHHQGKAWHALSGVKTLEPGEGLAGLRVDPVSPNKCDVILWSALSQLPQVASLPNTAPAAAVLPSPYALGRLAVVTNRLWDAEGNASRPFLQFQLSGSTNWQNATLTHLNGTSYSTTTRLSTSPGGVNHTVVWNVQADVGTDRITNVLLRARAQDLTLLGEWSAGTPFQVNTTVGFDADGDGLPDWWEIQHFGNLSNNSNGDFDGDGFSNWAELMADTNPTDPNSYLRITGIYAVPGGVRVDWQGGLLATQFLQQRWSLETNSPWQDIYSNLPPTSLLNSHTIFYDTNASSLFRIRAQRP